MADILANFKSAIPTGLYTGFEMKKDFMPEFPVECICLQLGTTGQSTKYFGQTESLDTTIVTMDVRSASYDTGYDTSEAIREYLDKFTNANFVSIIASSPTAILGKDNMGYRRFMVTFRIMVKE